MRYSNSSAPFTSLGVKIKTPWPWKFCAGTSETRFFHTTRCSRRLSWTPNSSRCALPSRWCDCLRCAIASASFTEPCGMCWFGCIYTVNRCGIPQKSAGSVVLRFIGSSHLDLQRIASFRSNHASCSTSTALLNAYHLTLASRKTWLLVPIVRSNGKNQNSAFQKNRVHFFVFAPERKTTKTTITNPNCAKSL